MKGEEVKRTKVKKMKRKERGIRVRETKKIISYECVSIYMNILRKGKKKRSLKGWKETTNRSPLLENRINNPEYLKLYRS